MESGNGFTFLLLFLPKDRFAIIPLAPHDLQAFFFFSKSSLESSTYIAFLPRSFNG